MQQLTPTGEQAVQDLAQRYGVSTDAVKTLLFAVSAGGGTMAQFSHNELGGSGQWMQGGMTMVGDMFNSGLQYRVSGLCSELSNLLRSTEFFLPTPSSSTGGAYFGGGNAWWPADLGQPSSSGSQNNARYAYFPHARRLAIDTQGTVALYDTLDHQIGGVQQQQGGPWGSLSFSSQFGTFTVDSLPRIVPDAQGAQTGYGGQTGQGGGQDWNVQSHPQPENTGDVFSALERLGQLHQQGILTDDEFRAKKAELLARL